MFDIPFLKAWFCPKYRFQFQETVSPTYFNLSTQLLSQHWSATRYTHRAHFSDQQFEFDKEAAECLEFKHLLARLVSQYCPQIMPETHVIHDTNWVDVLSRIAEQHYTKGFDMTDKVDDLAWILKPSLLNNGQHIKLFHRLSDIERHFLSSKRLGGAHVLQRYVTDPSLVEGKKRSLRLFVVLTNYAGAYLYQQGYWNEAIVDYAPSDFNDLRGHLTNEHLHSEASNVIQKPISLSLISPLLGTQIKSIITKLIDALIHHYPQAFVCQKQRTLALFGFDFMLDQSQQVWLLEANHSPCFPVSTDHPLQQPLYKPFWEALITSFVLPIAEQKRVDKIRYPAFEKMSCP